MTFDLNLIKPLPGVQAYLNEHWISDAEKERGRVHSGSPDNPGVYGDGTYDWYGGISFAVHPETILEVGVYYGYSMAAMLYPELYPLHATLVDMDKETPVGTLANTVGKLRQEFPSVQYTVHHIDSQSEWDQVERKPYDIIHIDADHTYRGCLNDLLHFGPLVSERGVIIAHDTIDPWVYEACMDFIYAYRMRYRVIDTCKGNIVMTRHSE